MGPNRPTVTAVVAIAACVLHLALVLLYRTDMALVHR